MNSLCTTFIMYAICLLLAANVFSADPSEPLLRNLPPGIFVDSSIEIPEPQTKSLGQKLGGNISTITNTVIRVHGQPIQVNVIQTVDEENAKAIHARLSKVKAHPYFTSEDGEMPILYVSMPKIESVVQLTKN